MIGLLLLLSCGDPSPEQIAREHARVCKAGDFSRCEKAVDYGLKFLAGKGDRDVVIEEERPKLAAELFAAACAQSSANGCAYYGRALQLGQGVDQDLEKAAENFELACGAGNAMACGRFGMMLEAGEGVPANSERAILLIDQACEQGQRFACNRKEEIEAESAEEDGQEDEG